MLGHKKPPEGVLAVSAKEDGVEVGRWRLGEKGVEALPRGARRVDDAAVGEAFDVGTAGLGDLAGAGDGMVVEEAPVIAQLGEGVELGMI